MLRKILATLLVSATLCTTALAADFTAAADNLHNLGLFAGTVTTEGTIDYALDSPCTRAEAAVMLVRLLGKEEEAQAGNYTTPFTDLYDWQEPYVGWLYTNGLTTGTSATTFSPEVSCTAQMYASFVLRALGYTSTDFAYENGIAMAEYVGIFDASLLSESDFRRDDVVGMSYLALFQMGKSEEVTLLEQLVAAGAVEEEAATALEESREANQAAAGMVSTAATSGLDATVMLSAQNGSSFTSVSGAVQRVDWVESTTSSTKDDEDDDDASDVQVTTTIAFNGTLSLSIGDRRADTCEISLVFDGSDWRAKVIDSAARYTTTEIIAALRNSGMTDFLMGDYLQNELLQTNLLTTTTSQAVDTTNFSWRATMRSGVPTAYQVQIASADDVAYEAVLSSITQWKSSVLEDTTTIMPSTFVGYIRM